MRLYETTLVIDSLIKSDDIERITRNLKEFISNNGGEVVRLEEWGKRRLAYEIEKKQYGYYIYIRYQAPPNIPKLLEREFRLNDNILRYLTVLVDPKLLLREERQKSAPQPAGRARPLQRPAVEPPKPKAEPVEAEVAPAAEPGEAEEAEAATATEPAEAAAETTESPATEAAEAETPATEEAEKGAEETASEPETTEAAQEDTESKEVVES